MMMGSSGMPALLRAFSPTSLGLTAWYRSTATSGDVTQWADVLGGTAIMFNAARAATAQADKALSFNGATPDVGSVQLGANNFNVNHFAIFLRAKPTAAAGTQTLFAIMNGTGGAVRCIEIRPTIAAFRVDVYSTSGGDGRRYSYNAQVAAGVARTWGVEFTSSGATELDRTVVSRDGSILVPSASVDLGAGGAPLQLVAATGRAVFGNFHDSAVASNPFTGLLGWDVFIRAGSRMAGATAGVMTQQARTNITTFEPLT